MRLVRKCERCKNTKSPGDGYVLTLDERANHVCYGWEYNKLAYDFFKSQEEFEKRKADKMINKSTYP